MSAFLKILEQLKAENRQIVVVINGSERMVLVTDITDDAVTLKEVDADNRYDLHYTQVVIVGS
jgi:ribosomal protein L25 (general stress protein Ctc)